MTQHRAYGGAAITGRPKRAGGDAPARQTAPALPTLPHESIPAFRKAIGAPERDPRRPWRRGHDGARCNHGYDAVEAKAKRASRLGAHRDYDGVLGEGGDGLKRWGHGEVDGGGAPASHEEEHVAPVDFGQPKRREQAYEER